jgi:hypothetical protein
MKMRNHYAEDHKGWIVAFIYEASIAKLSPSRLALAGLRLVLPSSALVGKFI